MLTLTEINRVLDRLGVGAFIPRTLAAHVATGRLQLGRDPERSVVLALPIVTADRHGDFISADTTVPTDGHAAGR